MTLFTLRGRVDALSWKEIGLPCVDLAPCKHDAERFLAQHACIEIIDRTTGRVVSIRSRRRTPT